MKDTILNWLNRFLVFDVFLVLFAFFWFAIALVGNSFNLNLGLDLWYKLWQPVFQTAIGVLMLGAILSWLIGLLKKLGNKE